MKPYLILINKQTKKALEKELVMTRSRHMQLNTITANYLVFLQVSKLEQHSISKTTLTCLSDAGIRVVASCS